MPARSRHGRLPDGFRLYIVVDEKGNLGKSLRGDRYYVIVGTMVVNREEFEAISRYYSTIRGREVKYHDDPDLREPIIRRAAPYVEDVYFVRYHKDPLVHNTPDGLPKDRKVATHLRMLQAMADRMIAEAGMYPVVVRIDYNRLVAGSDVPSVFECSPSRNGRDIRCQVMNSEDDFSLMTNDFIVGAVGDRVIDPSNQEAQKLTGFLKKRPKEVYLREWNRKTSRGKIR